MKLLPILIVLGGIIADEAKAIKLLNVSYDPTRELYQDFNNALSKAYPATSIQHPASGETRSPPGRRLPRY